MNRGILFKHEYTRTVTRCLIWIGVIIIIIKMENTFRKVLFTFKNFVIMQMAPGLETMDSPDICLQKKLNDLEI